MFVGCRFHRAAMLFVAGNPVEAFVTRFRLGLAAFAFYNMLADPRAIREHAGIKLPLRFGVCLALKSARYR